MDIVDDRSARLSKVNGNDLILLLLLFTDKNEEKGLSLVVRCVVGNEGSVGVDVSRG